MKVLYLIDSLEGYGAERSLVEIAKNLQKITPVFVHLYKGDKLRPSLEERSIIVYSLNVKPTFKYQEAINLISPIIRKENPDILHSTLFKADMVARKLKQEFPGLILVGSFVSNSYGKYRYSQLSLLTCIKLFSTQLRDRFTASHVDYFICNSKAIKASNIKALGIPKEKIKVIYRGRSFNQIENSKNLSLISDVALNLENQKIFLNVGRLSIGKGQLDLLYAFKKLHSVKKNVVLLIAGEGSLRDEITQTIYDLNLEQNVFLLGYREDIPELLQLADFFVFPTYYEGLPGALIEAIIAKKPSIVSSIEENKECLPNNGGLFFKPGNIGELFEKLEEAFHLQDWDRKTEIAYTYAQQNFNIKNISKIYDTFYQKILEE